MRPEIKEIERVGKNLDESITLRNIYGMLFYSFYILLLAILAFILIVFEPGKPSNRIVRYKQFMKAFKGGKK